MALGQYSELSIRDSASFSHLHWRWVYILAKSVEKTEISYNDFRAILNSNDKEIAEELKALILKNHDLNVLVNDIKKCSENKFKIRINEKVIKEFARHVKKKGEYLSPSELKIMSYVFNKTVKFYSDENAHEPEIINEGQKEIVAVQYKGGKRGHFERVRSIPLLSRERDNVKIVNKQLNRLQQQYNFSVKVMELLSTISKLDRKKASRTIYDLTNVTQKPLNDPQVLSNMFDISEKMLNDLNSLLDAFDLPGDKTLNGSEDENLIEERALLGHIISARVPIINFMIWVNKAQNEKENQDIYSIENIESNASIVSSYIDPIINEPLFLPRAYNDGINSRNMIIRKAFFNILLRCKLLYGDINVTDILHNLLIIEDKILDDLSFIETLLNHGAKIERHCRFYGYYNGYTALHIATVKNNINFCKWLIEKQGVDVNLKDAGNKTALDKAYKYQFSSMITYLISRGGISPYCDKLTQQLHDCIDAINWVDLGDKVEKEIEDEETLKKLTKLIKKGANVNGINDSGELPLHRLAVIGNRRFIKFFIESGADPCKRDRHYNETVYERVCRERNKAEANVIYEFINTLVSPYEKEIKNDSQFDSVKRGSVNPNPHRFRGQFFGEKSESVSYNSNCLDEISFSDEAGPSSPRLLLE
jgi:hypothetical protein